MPSKGARLPWVLSAAPRVGESWVYAFLKAKRERLGHADEPVDVPADLVDLS